MGTVRALRSIVIVATASLAAACTTTAVRPTTTPSAPHPTSPPYSSPVIDLAATPAGWVPAAYGDAQISVPADWKIIFSGGAGLCSGVAPGYVDLGPKPLIGCATSGMLIGAINQKTFQGMRAVKIHGLHAFVQRLTCVENIANGDTEAQRVAECLVYQVPSLGVSVTTTGPLRQQVMDTLTASPRDIALSPGPAPTVPPSWRWIAFGGIRIAAPSGWSVKRTVAAEGFSPPCSEMDVWPVNGRPVVVLDEDRYDLTYSCPVEGPSIPVKVERPSGRLGIDIGPHQPRISTTNLSCHMSGELRICIAAVPNTSVLAVRVTVPGRKRPVIVSIGLAGNGMTARTILYSMRRNSGPASHRGGDHLSPWRPGWVSWQPPGTAASPYTEPDDATEAVVVRQSHLS